MALGWAIYGTWNWWTWWLHEIRRRATDRREVIIRITRMFFCTLEHEIFLNTNNSNNTNIFLHTWTRIFFCTRISRISLFALDVCTRILRITRIFFLHTDLTDLTDFEPSARCEWQLVVVIDSLWLLACCGYWLVVVIGSLWLLACYVLNDKSKKMSVSHAKHWQIREIRVRNKNIRSIRSSCERTAANKDPWDLWDPCASSLK